jgi:hypothetical protein
VAIEKEVKHMKVTLESTSKIIQHSLGCGQSVDVRVWEGTTETGLPIRAFLTTIAPQDVEDLQRFDGELRAGFQDGDEIPILARRRSPTGRT